MACAPLPDPAFAHLLWQTAVGAWPIERERLHAYVEKAAREARGRDQLGGPRPGLRAGRCTPWSTGCTTTRRCTPSSTDFAAAITPAGWSNSLGQKLVQLTMPGVPDTYQGTELWDNSLVDPDNRRPVDFAVRRELLARIDGGWRPAGRRRRRGEAARRRRGPCGCAGTRPELFTGYRPVPAHGPVGRHVVAFDRGGAIAVATRLPLGLARAGGWRDTSPVTSRSRGERTCSPAGSTVAGRPPAGTTCWPTYPVALLAPPPTPWRLS